MQPDFLLMFDEEYTLKYSVAAEKMGFEYVWHADHYFPFQPAFKHTIFVWEVLAAIAARTKTVKVGPAATAPIGGRYHPMLIAQAAATMDRMFPGRFVLAVGSGEAINETRFLGRWPKWDERMGRLLEGVELIKRLWTEEEYFDFDGKYFKVPQAFLYLKPKNEIPIYLSAFGVKAAVVAGKHADRFITEGTVEHIRDVIFPKF
jgi:coenzyme F420-dependent glucose-6-phosphate dehydrogenase